MSAGCNVVWAEKTQDKGDDVKDSEGKELSI